MEKGCRRGRELPDNPTANCLSALSFVTDVHELLDQPA